MVCWLEVCTIVRLQWLQQFLAAMALRHFDPTLKAEVWPCFQQQVGQFTMNKPLQPQLLRLEDTFAGTRKAGTMLFQRNEKQQYSFYSFDVGGQLRPHWNLQLAHTRLGQILWCLWAGSSLGQSTEVDQFGSNWWCQCSSYGNWLQTGQRELQRQAGKRQRTEETVMARASTMKRARPSANRRPKMPASLRRVSRATKAVSLMIDPTARVKVTSQIVVALNVLCPRNVHEHEPSTTQCFSWWWAHNDFFDPKCSTSSAARFDFSPESFTDFQVFVFWSWRTWPFRIWFEGWFIHSSQLYEGSAFLHWRPWGMWWDHTSRYKH